MATRGRQRTLTVGASCLLHAGLVAAVVLAGDWLLVTPAENPPILPVEVITARDEPKPEPPKPLATKQPPPARRPPRPIVTPPPQVAETITEPLPEPKMPTSTPATPDPPPPVPPPSTPVAALPPPAAPAPATAAPAAPAPVAPPAASAAIAASPRAIPPGRPTADGIDSGPAPGAAAARPGPVPTPSGAAVASAPSRPGPGTAAITQAARPQGGYQVRPTYPSSARLLGIQGTTLLRVHVLIDGRVGDVRVQESAGHPDLDEAAADAVRRWRFEPARRGPEPVAMWVLLPVEFRLR